MEDLLSPFILSWLKGDATGISTFLWQNCTGIVTKHLSVHEMLLKHDKEEFQGALSISILADLLQKTVNIHSFRKLEE